MVVERRAGAILPLVLFGIGCASSSAVESRIEVLATREAALRKSIEGLEQDRASLEVDIAASTRQAEHAKCRAEVAHIQADISVREAELIGKRAEHLACVARNAKESSGLSAVLCMAGAVITGGAGLAICGSSLLLNDSAEQACGAMPIQLGRSQIERAILLSRGLERMPVCDDGDEGSPATEEARP